MKRFYGLPRSARYGHLNGRVARGGHDARVTAARRNDHGAGPCVDFPRSPFEDASLGVPREMPQKSSDLSNGTSSEGDAHDELVEAPLAKGASIVGRYFLDHMIGLGGMGEVWSATHAITGRRVALKFLKRSLSERPEMRRRVLRKRGRSTLYATRMWSRCSTCSSGAMGRRSW